MMPYYQMEYKLHKLVLLIQNFSLLEVVKENKKKNKMLLSLKELGGSWKRKRIWTIQEFFIHVVLLQIIILLHPVQ